MKKALPLLLLYLFFHSYTSPAQSLQSSNAVIQRNIPHAPYTISGFGGLGKASTCGTDTINYPFYKATVLQGLSLNASSSGSVFAQWYPAPQAITVSGFDFYAWQSAGTSAVVTLTCRMYNSTSDSLPTGTPLASVTVNVDSSFGGGSLAVLRKKVVFPTPVTTTANYVLTIETSSSVTVSVVANSWTASPPNGRSEWLSSVKIGSNYVRGYNVNVGTFKFNADFIFHPYASYTLSAGFTPSTICNQGGNGITFSNTSSPVIFSPFYSVRAFQNIVFLSSIWDYGDTSGLAYAVNGSKTYMHALPYTVKLLDTLYGYTTGCGDTYAATLSAAPSSPNATNNGPLCPGATLRLFADSIPGATYYWTGPNNFTSGSRDPVIGSATSSMNGFYSVRSIIGQCSSAVTQTYVTVVTSPSASSNAPVCSGQNLQFFSTEISGASYAWTGPNSFSSTQRNPVISGATAADSGQYSVSITVSGCGTLGPFSTVAAVNPIPSTPSVSNNGPLCTGDNLNLTASSTAGSTYSWTGPASFSSTQQNPSRGSVQNSFAGTYTVMASRNGCNSATASTTVTVNNTPSAPTAGNNGPLCSGQTLSLTATAISGATYAWSGPNSFTSTSQNPTRASLTLTDAGTYSVIATVNGCASQAATTTVVITSNTPTPTVSSNGPLCPGQNLQLTASAISGASYSWTGPNSFTSAQQNPSISNVSTANAGLYSVTAVTTGCGSSPAGTVTVTINTLPSAPTVSNNGPLCEGDSIHFSASSITGAVYYWSGPNGFASNAQNPVIPNAATSRAGDYSVYVAVTGCGNSSGASTTLLVHKIPLTPGISSNAPVCAGDSLYLDALSSTTGPNASFAWSGPNFASSSKTNTLNAVSADNAGVYSVTVSDSGCTSPTAGINVAVKAIPPAPTPSSNAPICSGSNLFLNASQITNAVYSWTGPNGYQSTARNPIISGATAAYTGTYAVRSNVNGCASVPATVSVLVNELPPSPVASNNGPKCIGDHISLSATSVANATYNWTGPGSFVSTDQNPVLNNVNTAMAGNYNVVAISSAGCNSPAASTTVVVNNFPSPPTLSSIPSGPACEKDSVQLFAGFVSDATYEWSGPAGFGSTARNPVLRNVSPANSGAYSAVLSKGGCISQPATINITVTPTPQTSAINGPASAKSNEVHAYSVTGSTGSTYQWVVTGGVIQSGQGTNSISIKWGLSVTCLIAVRETTATGCPGAVKQLNVSITTGIDDLQQDQKISLYPNPASGMISIRFEQMRAKETSVNLTDISGKAVLEKKLIHAKDETMNLDISSLTAGVYFVNIGSESIRKVFKLIVQ